MDIAFAAMLLNSQKLDTWTALRTAKSGDSLSYAQITATLSARK